MTAPATLCPPISLQCLQSLSNYTTVSCVGRSFPTRQRCNRTIDAHDKALSCAVRKLRNLSKNGLKHHGAGLISALQSIAVGFSCEDSHRHFRGQREQLPYYWIALDSMPNFLRCMGLDGPITKDCSPGKKSMIHDEANELAPAELWYVHNAINGMNAEDQNQFWNMDGNGDTANYFRDTINERVTIDASDVMKRREQLAAQDKWRTWHQCLDANNDDYEDEDLHNDICQPSEGSEYDHVFYAALPDSQDATISDLQQLRSNGSAATKERLTRAKPQASTAPSPTPQAAQATTIRGEFCQTPPMQQKRPSPSLLSPSNSTSSSLNAQIARTRRRCSAPPNSHHRPEVLPKHRQVRTDDHVSTAGQRANHKAGETRSHSLSSFENNLGDPKNSDVYESFVRPTTDFLRFSEYEKPKSKINVIQAVFEKMRQPLNGKTAKDQEGKNKGFIYAFRMPQHPGFIKIGRTKNDIDVRKARIESCTGAELEPINPGDVWPVLYHEKVEKLIHEALQPHRRKFLCGCKTRRKTDSDGVPTAHGEWFKIDEKEAIDTISRWRHWMNVEPYRDNRLKDSWVAHIDDVNKRIAEPVNTINRGKDLDDFDWDDFLSLTWWRSVRKQVSDYFYKGRPERNDSSPRLESLWKHRGNNFFRLWWFLLALLFMSAVPQTFRLSLGNFVAFAFGFSVLLSTSMTVHVA